MPSGADLREREHALALAFRHIGRRERTVAEVRAHLAAKGVPDTLTEAVVTELRADGYLDDGRFAHMFVHDKRALEGWGNDRIARALAERGLGRELIAQALAEEAEAGELERALAILRRRWAEPPVEPRERERALGVLIRKGYDSELALDAIRAYARGDSAP